MEQERSSCLSIRSHVKGSLCGEEGVEFHTQHEFLHYIKAISLKCCQLMKKTRLVHASFVTTYMFTGCKQVLKEFQILIFVQEVWVLFSGILDRKTLLSRLFLNVLGPLEDKPLSFTRMWPLIFRSLHIGQICLRRPEATLPLTI